MVVSLDGGGAEFWVVGEIGDWVENWGWMGWMGRLEWMGVVGVVTPVNSEQGVNRLGTSPMELV